MKYDLLKQFVLLVLVFWKAEKLEKNAIDTVAIYYEFDQSDGKISAQNKKPETLTQAKVVCLLSSARHFRRVKVETEKL